MGRLSLGVAAVLVCLFVQHAESQRTPVLSYALKFAHLIEKTEKSLAVNSFLNHPVSVPQRLSFANHNRRRGGRSNFFASRANFLNDLGRFLNAPRVPEMLSQELQLNQEVETMLGEMCPAPVDCSTRDLTFRPIDNECNNLINPRFGNPNIAQTRIAPAFYEDSMVVREQLTEFDHLIPTDPHGVQLQENKKMYFQLQGNAGVEVDILSPDNQCSQLYFPNSAFDQTQNVPGIIFTATYISNYYYATCRRGRDFFVSGNHLNVLSGCYGVFEVCYQPVHAQIELNRRRGETSSIKINGVVQATSVNSRRLYGARVPQGFWINVNQGQIDVGFGSGSETSEPFMSARSPLTNLMGRLENSRNTMAMVPMAGPTVADVEALIPVRDVIMMETDEDDLRLLEGLDFLFDEGSMVMGIETAALSSETVRVQMIDETNDAAMTMLFGDAFNIMIFSIGDTAVSSEVLDATQLGSEQFVDSTGTAHPEYSAIWMTYRENTGVIGSGNIAGKHSMVQGLDMLCNFEFAPTRVELRSTGPVQYMFDVAQPGTPRSLSVSGRALPTARDVSLVVHSNIGQEITWSNVLTMAVMQFGQFVDHDVILTPLEEAEVNAEGSEPIMCCENNQPIEGQCRYCFNIEITSRTDLRGSQGAFPFPENRCIPFTRSAATVDCNAETQDLRSREQLNTLTSFIDGSNIYGSLIEQAEELRTRADHTGAKLRTSDRNGPTELPETDEPEEECRNEDLPADFLCHAAGDIRVNEQPGLTSMHTLWVREHNRVVDELVRLHGYPQNTVAERELLYQEARRVVIAEYQFIVYNEYLLSFMDDGIHSLFDLKPDQCVYDATINAGVNNEWGLVNRIGHTWINPSLIGESQMPQVPLVDEFFSPEITHVNGSDGLLVNLFKSQCPETDRLMETVVTEDLFRDGLEALDLAALNVQRGRDHGVNYARTRQALGLPVPETFQEAVGLKLFTPENAAILASVYDAIEDIDLFTAVVAEVPLRNIDSSSTSTVGETLNHVQGNFFRRAKCGDRYWYEFLDSGFTAQQVAEIEKASFSRVMCDNVLTPSSKIQRDSFLVTSASNPEVACSQLPSIDLSIFTPRFSKRSEDLAATLEQVEQAETVADVREADVKEADVKEADVNALEEDVTAELKRLLESLSHKEKTV